MTATAAIWYVGNVFSDDVLRERQIASDSPAATAKVTALCRAARRAGEKVGIVSLGRGGCRSSWRRYGAKTGRLRGVPTVYLPFWDVPLFTHLVTMISLCGALWRLTRPGAVLVFYNPQPHYLPALLLLRLLGRRCVLDLEDGCRADDCSMRGTVHRLVQRIFGLCCRDSAMFASASLKSQVPARRQLVCYGVAPAAPRLLRWADPPLQVLLSGSLLEDTGALLFLRALDLLREESPETLATLRFAVTGFGACAEQVREAAEGRMKDFLTFHGRVSTPQYREILQACRIGLCLKLPGSSMGSTTFPSKVVELAAHGLLLVSTRVSDVALLFPAESALLLPEATPEALADVLRQVARDPARAARLALAGQRRVTTLLSEERVGRDLVAFWNGACVEGIGS